MKRLIVIGGGAAGMMAAISAGEYFRMIGLSVEEMPEILLIERNEKLGKKLFITGKGRCNVTNSCDTEDFFPNVMRNPKFLYSSIYGFDNLQTMEFFESHGLSLKIERGGRVFPVSDHSSDVIRCLQKALQDLNVRVLFNTRVMKLSRILGQDSCFEVVCTHQNKTETFEANAVILATGGLSYPVTGSTGDGHRFLEKIGHTMKECMPSLIPLLVREDDPKRMQGLSLKNVKVTVRSGKKQLFQDFGEMLFTHFGVSGPLILSASAVVGDYLKKGNLQLSIDLKPALDNEMLDQRILRDFEDNINKNFENAIGKLLPNKMIPVIIQRCGIDPYKKVHDITKEERILLVSVLKDYTLTITGLRDIEEAIITRGGANVKEFDPSTMESKLCPGIYAAGEVLDLDAVTGGYNLQIAWSTGHLAGMSAAESLCALDN